MKKLKKTDMPPLVPQEEEEDTPVRTGSGAKWVTLLCVILAVALVIASLPSGISAVTKVNSKVLSGEPVSSSISTVLSGGGTLTPQEGVAQSLPKSLEIKTYYVKNSQTVSTGDPIAAVDPVAVATAVAELQGLLETLDKDLTTAGNKHNDTSIQAGAAGRVKAIYAQEGTAAADTMYDNGALLLLSLDGLMAVDLPAALEVGQTVQVTLSDGSQLEGSVDSVSDGVSTVTLSDEKAPLDDRVIVADENGKQLGEGTLSVHSALRVTGAFGTVSRVHVRLDQKVTAGTTLLTLKDTGHTPEYARLLNRRAELEEQMDSLMKLAKDGILYADCDGIVSGVDSSVSYTAPASLTQARSHASPGYTVIIGTRMENQSPSTEQEQQQDPVVNEHDGEEDGKKEDGSKEDGSKEDKDPETETATYILGKVTDVSEISSGKLMYSLQRTINAEQIVNQSFAGLLSPDGGTDPQPLLDQGQTVLLSVGGEWITSSFDQIAENDAILIGTGIIVHQRTGSGSNNPSGMDPSQIAAAAAGAMASMTGGLTGYGSASTAAPAYDTYDTTQQDAAVITAEEEMTVQIQVDELDVLSLQTGMEADITLDALPGSRFTGSITAINPYGENSGGNTKYTVTVKLPRDEKMLPGMNASVKITTAVSPAVQTIPAEAIVFDAGSSWLYTAYDEKTDTLGGLVEIQTGLSDGSLVELLSGLPEGSRFYYRYADSIEYSFVK